MGKIGFLLLLLVAASNASPLLIGAFNIQIFGQSKMSKPEVVDILVKIIQRYDIVVVQEIRDAEQTAFPRLVDEVNAVTNDAYSFVISGRTGRSSSKEQYGYIFKHDVVEVSQEYQYPDNKDVFEREPYAVQFQRISNSDSQKTFSYVALHAKPDDAVAEIDALVAVYEAVVTKFGDNNVLLAGDFNADCSYVCGSCWSSIDLWTDDRFTWLLGNEEDTTVSSTDCAYDRIVVAGDSMSKNSVRSEVFLFDEEYSLSYEMAKDVSDHYPVEFTLN